MENSSIRSVLLVKFCK